MEENKIGKMYVVPTPIGNLQDITLRALNVLKEVDLIAAEDTRQTLKLLNHFEIKKKLISYHKFNEENKSDSIIYDLYQGRNIALVSDAGMPGISDPGSVLISKCIDKNIELEVLPGATAVITALVYSGLDTTKFIFRGFIPRDKKKRDSLLKDIENRTETLVFYEAPHRLISTLNLLKEKLGDRSIAVCKELTKIHENIMRGSLSEVIQYYGINSPRGEYVLILQGKSLKDIEEEEIAKWKDISIEDHIRSYMEKGNSKKESVKLVAKERKIPKSEVYKYSIDI